MTKWLTTAEAAAILGERTNTIAVWCGRGKLKAIKDNRTPEGGGIARWLIDADSVMNYSDPVLYTTAQNYARTRNTLIRNISDTDPEKRALFELLDEHINEMVRHRDKLNNFINKAQLLVEDTAGSLDI